MIIIDSHGWIEYLAAGKLSDKYAKYIEEASYENTITPTVVVYEVYKKIKREKGEEKALEVYAQIMRTRVIPLTEELAMSAADASLKLGLSMADAIIIATAENEKATLVTSDAHFKGFENVEFIE